MANCAGVAWGSVVKKKVTGTTKERASFEITNEAANGDFTGVFTFSNGTKEAINGNCSTTHIWFVRPSANPAFRYEGDIVTLGGKKTVPHGERRQPVTPLKNQRQSKLTTPPPGPDDWIAEQGTTITTKTAKKATKKAAKKSTKKS
jgi:hypothetical protein